MPIPLQDSVLIMLKRNLLVKIVVFTLVVCSCLSFTGCNDSEVSSEINDNKTVFVDALGRTVSIGSKPQRVATLIGSFAEVWQLSGGDVIATADDAWSDLGLELGDALNIGGAHSPNIELLLSSEPDFVIASASTASNVSMKDTLESVGITVAYFDVDCFDDYLDMLHICTDITGRKDLYNKNGTAIKEQIDDIKQRFNALNLSDSKRTVLLLRASSGAVKAKGSDGTVLGEMLNDMGCINIADSDKTLLEKLSVESIIQKEPYHIFVVTMGDDSKAIDNFAKTMEENPAWASLEAVKEDRLHFMDRKMFNLKPNVRWAISYEELYNILCQDE